MSSRQEIHSVGKRLVEAVSTLAVGAARVEAVAVDCQQRASTARKHMGRLRSLCAAPGGEIRLLGSGEAVAWRLQEVEAWRANVQPVLDKLREFRDAHSVARARVGTGQDAQQRLVDEAVQRAQEAPRKIGQETDQVEERVSTVLKDLRARLEQIREWSGAIEGRFSQE